MKEINITNNYDIFKKLEGNRATSVNRVNKIKKSIMEVGYITSPILVNEEMEIIDGQGRYEALKELNLPIEYIVQPGINIKECIAMNVYQTNWTLQDYIKSYADKGVESYVLLDKLMKKFPYIKRLETFAAALFSVNSMDTEKTKSGNLEISTEQYENAEKKLEYIYSIIENYKNIARIGLITKGMIHCLAIEGLDKDWLKEKVIEVLEADRVPPIPTMDDVMRFLEETYNKYKRGKTLYIHTEYRKQVEERQIASIKAINERNFQKMIMRQKTYMEE